MRGRKPIEPDTARKQRLLDALTAGATLKMAARAAGVSEDTLARWRVRHKGLADEMTQAEASGAVAALAQIQRAAANGSWQAAAWLLERRYPDDFGRVARTQQQQPDTFPHYDAVADARLAKIVRETATKLGADFAPH